MVVRCRDTADIVAAVKFARSHRMPLVAKGGGHSISGASTIDGGMLVDLSLMRGVAVDLSRKTVTVQGGALWGDVDHATQLHGLAVPGGFVSTTGVAGFTLGGGIAWTSRKLGLACDNLISAELVNASGEVLEVSAKNHPDLFWALRGAGSSFGIVSTFRFRLQRVGPLVYGGMRGFPGDRAGEILRLVADLYERTPPELNVLAVLTTAPPAPFVPQAFHGKPVVVVGCCYFGPVRRGPRATKEICDIPGAVVDQVGPLPYVALQSAFDALNPFGLRNYWKSTFLPSLSEEAIQTVVERYQRIPSPMSEIHFQYGGGAIGKVPDDQSVIGNRSVPYLFNLIAKWTDPGTDQTNVAYVRDLWSSLQKFSTGGVYSNFNTDLDEKSSRGAFGDANLLRLAQLKRVYDPDQVFTGNQKILPAPA
ncbi:MAG TPA: FAD-binding oxidoreductase [Thermoplasmata archaeon]|nr:FAD-binding oxidoreductase [Thermoplasmata archaeon]